MKMLLIGAGALSLLTFLIHLIAGGKEIARPLLAAEGLARGPKLVAYYCWHMVSILLAVMAGSFLYAAVMPEAVALAVVMTVLAGCFALLSLGLAVATRSRLRDLPQWAFFVAIAIPATLALVMA